MRIRFGVLLAVLLSQPVQADVGSVAANGFDLQWVMEVKAPPTRVYDAMVHVGRWWSAEHTYSGDATRMRLDARAGGCFCESLTGGGSVEHGRVVFAQRPRLLRFVGALGPLQAMGLTAVMSWRLEPVPGGGTRLLASYSVGGHATMPFEQLAPGVDGVLGAQLQRLKSYVETGKAD